MTPGPLPPRLKLNMAFKLGSSAAAVALVAALAVGCTGTGAPPATAADAARAGASLASLEDGRTLYMAHCSSCHTPPSPSSQAVSAWPGHVDEMQTRAHLSNTEASLVKQYLVTVASR